MEYTGKNLVICCDGTGNWFGDDNSNVVRLSTSLEIDPSQVAYYHPGVGTMGAANVTGRVAKTVTYAEEPVWYPQADLMQELAAGGYGVYRLKGGVKKEASSGKALGVAAALLMMAGVGWAMFRR